MRIATWNIGWGFISTDNNSSFELEDIGYFSTELKRISPDVICLQEAHFSKYNDQSRIIADSLGYDFVETFSIADSHLKEGEKLSISIVSKYPMVSTQFHMLPNPNLEFVWNGKKAISHDKGLLEMIVDYKGVPVRIFSGHMVPFGRFKKDFLSEEFSAIRDWIVRACLTKDIPTVIGADMNFENIQSLLPGVFNAGYILAPDIIPTTSDGRRYDKIIVSKDWVVLDLQIIQGVADHYLCFADLIVIK